MHGPTVKPTIYTISQIYFVLEQHSTCFGLTVHRQESKTVHTASGIGHTGSVERNVPSRSC
jgi:hypothetical protein